MDHPKPELKYVEARALNGYAARLDGAEVLGSDGGTLGMVEGFIVDAPWTSWHKEYSQDDKMSVARGTNCGAGKNQSAADGSSSLGPIGVEQARAVMVPEPRSGHGNRCAAHAKRVVLVRLDRGAEQSSLAVDVAAGEPYCVRTVRMHFRQ